MIDKEPCEGGYFLEDRGHSPHSNVFTFSLLGRFVLIYWIFVTSGCSLVNSGRVDGLPSGVKIPVERVPEIVLPAAQRSRLPSGTTVEHCEGDLYRFTCPDGNIWFRNARVELVGGVI